MMIKIILGSINDIENKINEWLEQQRQITIVDIDIKDFRDIDNIIGVIKYTRDFY